MILQQLKPRRLSSQTKFYAPVSKKEIFKGTGLFPLEKGMKSVGGATTLRDITKALDEYKRLFKAGIASNAEKLTLARAFPDDSIYVEAAVLVPTSETMVIGGPASVELIDREGHMITNDALNNAFKKYMDNFRTRNAMVLHSDVQVGWALPAYITKGGQIFKSGVGDAGLFFICELRGDTKIADKVAKQIEEGKLRSYSIAGSATKIQQMQKGLMPYMQVDEMELAEVTVCEKGVNQAAGFEILKAEDKNSKFPDEDEAVLIVDPEEDKPKQVSHVSVSINLLEKEDGDIDFTNTFFNYMTKIRSEKIGRSFGDESAKGKRGGSNVGEVHIRDITEPHRKRGPKGDRFAYEEERQKRDAKPKAKRGSYDPYLDEPVTPKSPMTAEERKQKNIIPSIMDRSIENTMAETSPAAPKTPNKPPSKTRRGGEPPESNGHYPNKKIPTNTNLVHFLDHMEKDMASDMASGWGDAASAGDFQATMTGTKEQRRAARQALKNKLAGGIKSGVAQDMAQGQQTTQPTQQTTQMPQVSQTSAPQAQSSPPSDPKDKFVFNPYTGAKENLGPTAKFNPYTTNKDPILDASAHSKTPYAPNTMKKFLNKMFGVKEKTVTTGEYTPRGVGRQKRKSHITDVE